MKAREPEQSSVVRWMVVTSGGDPHHVAQRFLSCCGCGVAAELESVSSARVALAKLVEDENAVRHPAMEFLKQCGYTVIEARDGLQAVDAVHKHERPIDLMVTDVVMPGMGGGQLAELLAEKYPTMKVLFVLGYSEQVVLRHRIASLRSNFLQKPFTLKSLAAKVRERLDATAAAAVGAGQ